MSNILRRFDSVLVLYDWLCSTCIESKIKYWPIHIKVTSNNIKDNENLPLCVIKDISHLQKNTKSTNMDFIYCITVKFSIA